MESSNPRVYVLDEEFKLILAPPSSPDDPLNHLYEASTAADVLPPVIEGVIRALTSGWERGDAPREASASVNGVRVAVSPLHGPVGPHFAVRVEHV